MLVGLSCRLVPIGDLVMVSRSVHNGSVVCDPLGISIHCPARFVQAPLYFPGELQYSFKHEARSPVWVALIVQYSLSVGVYSRFLAALPGQLLSISDGAVAVLFHHCASCLCLSIVH